MLRILDERRRNLLHTKNRLINQLHALLRQLLPGGVQRISTLRRRPTFANVPTEHSG